MSVERYSDHFSERNVSDQEWLLHTAERRWVALTHDDNIRRDREALRVVMENGGRLFIIRGTATTAELAGIVLEAQLGIERLLSLHEVFVAIVRRATKRGGQSYATAEVRLTYEEWLGRPPG